jgi:hypothetical protein
MAQVLFEIQRLARLSTSQWKKKSIKEKTRPRGGGSGDIWRGDHSRVA